ncbi:hypothetical protein VNO78_01762 [Psophocarpus tetragonolobus]|uniref:Uncharacterized protein n=1 Tax=Psophocarpus tetragonolobus TaxID=3891 RepID=A0AAN9XUU1_PSOTE
MHGQKTASCNLIIQETVMQVNQCCCWLKEIAGVPSEGSSVRSQDGCIVWLNENEEGNLSDGTLPEEEDVFSFGDQCEKDDPMKWDPQIQKMETTQGKGKVVCDLTRLEEVSTERSVSKLPTMSKCQQGQEPEIRGTVDNLNLHERDIQMPKQSKENHKDMFKSQRRRNKKKWMVLAYPDAGKSDIVRDDDTIKAEKENIFRVTRACKLKAKISPYAVNHSITQNGNAPVDFSIINCNKLFWLKRENAEPEQILELRGKLDVVYGEDVEEVKKEINWNGDKT